MELSRTRNGVPFVRVGGDAALVVLNGGQGFVRQPSPERQKRDAARVARLLPIGRAFVLLGYRSDPAPDLSIDALADEMADAIAEVAGDRPVDLLGISYGGMIACRVAARRRRCVRRLVLAASGHRFSGRGAAHVRAQAALLEAGDLVGFTKAFSRLFRRFWFNWLIGLTIQLGGQRVRGGTAPATSVLPYLRAMLHADPPDLAAIHAPTFVIGGAKDQFFGDGVMEELAAGVAAGQLRVLGGETHMAPIERAAAFRSSIAAFIA